jgi:hypothetical protein
METKREMREAAIERLRGHINHPKYYRSLIQAIVGDDYDELTVEECDKRLIDLLTDNEDDAYMRVPVDADDIPIHIGDRVVEHEDGHDFIVDGYEYDGECWVFHRDGIRAPAHDCTRHNVMDVLSELVLKVYEEAWSDGKNGVRYDMYEFEKLIKEYSEKLQLKEGEDE